MFHFDCRCIPCVNNYPLARELPDTYSAMAKLSFPNQETPKLYMQRIKDGLDKFKFDLKNPNCKANFMSSN